MDNIMKDTLAKVFSDRDVKETILALKHRLRILEMMLTDCDDMYQKRYERRQKKRLEEIYRKASNVLFVGTLIMILVCFVIEWIIMITGSGETDALEVNS